MTRKLMSVVVMLLFVTIAVAQEKPAEMSAEEQAMMEAFAKAATPGEPHEHLAKQVGEWDVKARFWMEPGEPMVSEGTATRTMMLDGRVLSESFKGEFMGMPFMGHGMTGYDNITGQYWSTWNDTMSTGLMRMDGQCTESGDKCSWVGSNIDPMTGKMMYTKGVSTTQSGDRETFESYVIGPDGKDVKMMELVYTRKKK